MKQVEPKPECTKDSDCGTGKACKESKCVAVQQPPTQTGTGAAGKGGSQQAGAGTAGGTEQNGGAGWLFLILGGLVVLAILAGGAWFFLMKPKAKK